MYIIQQFYVIDFYYIYSWRWSGSCMALERMWGDTPRAKAEKPQKDGRCYSSSCVALKWLWEDTPHPRAKEKPQQDGRRGEIAFRIKSHTHQRHSEGSNKTLCAPGQRGLTETEPDLPMSVQESPWRWGSIAWPQAKQQGGNRAPPFNRKLD